MLVLTRKRGEVIQIGDEVVVKVIKTGRGAVKIGIEAPADIRVVRGELAPLQLEDNPEPCDVERKDPVTVEFIRQAV